MTTEKENSATAPLIVDVDVLGATFNIPAWKQAALKRFMGWSDGKFVPIADYENALQKLKERRLGGM